MEITTYQLLSGASAARPKASVSQKLLPPYLDKDTKQSLSNRLSRIEGHVRSIKTMVQDERPPQDILLQVSAVKAALNKFSAALIEHDLQTNVRAESPAQLEKTLEAIKNLLKQS